MSTIKVTNLRGRNGSPTLPDGAVVTGVATATTFSGTLDGSLKTTGTPTLGLGVTINSSGVAISGVATAGIVSATTLYGDGTNLTGIAATLAPLFYHPDIGDAGITFGTGIGITFNQQIKAGTGNITIRETNASGTVVENFGVGSSVTISENRVTFSPTSDLSEDTIYHVSYPSGCFTNNEGTDYVGTAYPFQGRPLYNQLWMWGRNQHGQLAQNNAAGYSSPIQVPGTNWVKAYSDSFQSGALKSS